MTVPTVTRSDAVVMEPQPGGHRPDDSARQPGPMSLIRPEPQLAVDVAVEGSAVVLTIRGCLDAAVGAALVDAAATAVGGQVARLDIDLRSLTDFTDEGADFLVACRTLSTGLPEGLHYCTGQGPGRDALLAAYAEQ